MAPDARRLSAFRELALANWRELVRDPSGLFLMIGFPLVMFGLMLLFGLSADGVRTDLVRMMLPFTLFLFYSLLGFYTLGYQTVQLRRNGTLRLLGLTPLRRLTYIAAQLPPRLAIALGQLLLLAAAGALFGLFSVRQLPGLLFGSLLGILLFFSLAYFVGGIFRIPEAAVSVPMALLPIIMVSAGMFPLETVPRWLAAIGRYSPFTYWFDLINHSLLGSPLQHPLWLSISVLVGTTAAMTALTALTFRWDQGET